MLRQRFVLWKLCSRQNFYSKFKIQDLLDKSPLELQDSEKEKVAICSSLIHNPKILLLDEAIYKAFMGTGIQLPKRKNIICTIKDSSKEEFLPIAKQYYMFGYDLYATEGTYKFLKEHDVPVHFVNRICEKTNTIFDLMFTDTVDLVIDIPTRNDNLKDGFLIRRFAVEAGIPIYTSLDTAKALIDSLEKRKQGVPSLIDITKLR